MLSGHEMRLEIGEDGDGTNDWKAQARLKTKSVLNGGGRGRNE